MFIRRDDSIFLRPYLVASTGEKGYKVLNFSFFLLTENNSMLGRPRVKEKERKILGVSKTDRSNTEPLGIDRTD